MFEFLLHSIETSPVRWSNHGVEASIRDVTLADGRLSIVINFLATSDHFHL